MNQVELKNFFEIEFRKEMDANAKLSIAELQDKLNRIKLQLLWLEQQKKKEN